jgi:hypothetical protein
MITREEMLERLDECWDSTERGLYPDDNNSSDTRQVSRNIAARDAIRALLTAPEVKRVSVKMESIRWIFDRAVGEMGNGIGAGVIAAWLSDIGVEVTSGEVVDGGKPEVDAEVTKREVGK